MYDLPSYMGTGFGWCAFLGSERVDDTKTVRYAIQAFIRSD